MGQPPRYHESRVRMGVLPLNMVLWGALWLNLGSDYTNLSSPSGLLDWFHALRAVLPFLAVALACSGVTRGKRFAFAWQGPLRLMALYGVIALASSLLSVAPFRALYWGGLYVSAFIVMETAVAGADPLDRSARLLILMWLVVAAYAVGLTVISWDILFDQGGWLFSDREIINEMPVVAGVGMSRSTGVGRFAAVAAVLAFARLRYMRGANRLLFGAAFCGFVAVALMTRARMPLLGLVAGVVFVMLVRRGRAGLFLAACALALVMLADVTFQEGVGALVYKRRSSEDLMTMAGRTEVWKAGWQVFLQSPLLGLGPLADRFHMGWICISNTWLLALMQAGILGTAFFVASWVIGWRLFFRNLRSLEWLQEKHQVLLVEAGAVLAFFTIRSIPETTAAALSVDLLAIVPILAYLEILDRSLRHARVRQGARRVRDSCGRSTPTNMMPPVARGCLLRAPGRQMP